MRLVFTPRAWADYQHWLALDRAVLKRLNRLIEDCLRDPMAGIGKPERLKGPLTGAWSRRITDEHRLVYRIDGDDVVILASRYHYDDR